MTMHNVPSAEVSTSLDWLLTPALAFSHPSEVLRNPDLTDPERKAILASWDSDARAVEDMPWQRRLESGAIVSLADVLAALRALDRATEDESPRSVPPCAAKPFFKGQSGLTAAMEAT